SDETEQLLHGTLLTFEASAFGTAFGLLVGIAAAILRRSTLAPLRWAVAFYVSFIRGTPLFVQILIIYFLLPRIGLDFSPLQAGIVALSINSAAYISEMIRGALTAIPVGQIEAAKALAIPRPWIWLKI